MDASRRFLSKIVVCLIITQLTIGGMRIAVNKTTTKQLLAKRFDHFLVYLRNVNGMTNNECFPPL